MLCCHLAFEKDTARAETSCHVNYFLQELHSGQEIRARLKFWDKIHKTQKIFKTQNIY